MGLDERFPARRVYCVGRNYIDHIREMGSDEREPPFFFQKPADALVLDGGDFPYPPLSENVHYEIELVVAIGKAGRNIVPADALDHVYGYAVGFDMTRRDLQGVAKDMRRPWEAGKAFDHAAPCSAIVPATDIGHPETGAIWLKVNRETRQEADLSHQIWSVPESISHLSELFELVPGDLIFTGTPSGVGPVKPGDTMVGGIEGVGELTVQVV
ncbi:MAG: fumarylacetoacetate hydrolase family protein [Rhodospirillales bacterium]|nr:fumarylacetoacetate hydrolase family protein [Rhodospirillales bacterium]